MKKILLFLTLICFSAVIVTFAAPQGYIRDYAGVLSPAMVSTLNVRARQLEDATRAQIVVVIRQSLPNDEPIEDFAYNYFNTHGIGDAELDNGVLVVISIEERVSRIEVGHGLEGRLTDGRTGRIQDEFLLPYLRVGNFDAAIENAFSVLLTEIALEYDVEIDGTLPQSPFERRGMGIFEILIFVAIFGGGLPFLMWRGRRRGPPGSGGFGGPMGPMGPGGFGGPMGRGGSGGRPGGGFGGFGGGMSRGGGSSRRW